jgi:hypothetical protein
MPEKPAAPTTEPTSEALLTLARYVMRHHACERWFPNPVDPVDACGECVPCHAVGVVEGDGEAVAALAAAGVSS